MGSLPSWPFPSRANKNLQATAQWLGYGGVRRDNMGGWGSRRRCSEAVVPKLTRGSSSNSSFRLANTFQGLPDTGLSVLHAHFVTLTK